VDEAENIFAPEVLQVEKPNFSSSESKPYDTPLPSVLNPFPAVQRESQKQENALSYAPVQISSGGNFSTYNDLMQSASLEKELLQAGYLPREKIFVRKESQEEEFSEARSGDSLPAFIKASNKLGQTVYIMVDGKGYVVARQGDLTLIQSKNASVLPYSLKIGVMECAGLDVCGVAFECDDEICTLIRDEGDTTVPRETTFTLAQKRAPAAIVDQDHVAYPIVRLSEIRADPAAALANTMASASRIRRAAAQNCVSELTALKCAIEELTLAYNRFIQTRDDFDEKICRSLLELEEINRSKFSAEPTTERGRENLRKVRYNLRKRYEFSDALLRACRKASGRVGQIRRNANELNLLSEYCLKEFSGVEFVLEETA